ncbi:hypothetical protein I3760_09G175100 [Carya illinoinensis]|nr:hypothetical protein I3760_09G175100 [Carya illinoinensis]
MMYVTGVKALNKTHFSTSHLSGGRETIAFVTVFAIYNPPLNSLADDRSSNLITVGNSSYGKVERSMALLNIFINFIQVTMPQSNIVILTELVSDLRMRRNRVTVHPVQGEYSRDKLMLQRIRSYISYPERRLEELSHKEHVTHYIFTDSDIAVVDDLGQIFPDYSTQPLNSGFIAVRGTTDGILALAWIVKSDPSFDTRKFTKQQVFLEKIGGVSVIFLPCAIYNWTPPKGAGQFHGMPMDVKVLHFKKSRKRLMFKSWNFFRSFANLSDMLCLILSSWRTKYDF